MPAAFSRAAGSFVEKAPLLQKIGEKCLLIGIAIPLLAQSFSGFCQFPKGNRRLPEVGLRNCPMLAVGISHVDAGQIPRIVLDP